MTATIRIPSEHWGRVWRALVAVGSVSRISEEPIYVIIEEQLRMLRRKKLLFEVICLSFPRSSVGTHDRDAPRPGQ